MVEMDFGVAAGGAPHDYVIVHRMNIRQHRNTFRLICAGALTAFLVACGDPGAERKAFVFTPVPYTVIPEGQRCRALGCGTAVSIDEAGREYFADLVIVRVKDERAEDIADLIDQYGFNLTDRTKRAAPGPGSTRFVFEVPLGSVLEVIEFFAGQDGVTSAEPSVIGHLLEI